MHESKNATRHLTVRDAYDLWADGYDAQDNPMVMGARQIVRATLPDFAGRAVVEFGCGTGRNLETLLRGGASRVAGVDLSPGMLARARTRVPDAALIEGDFAAAHVPPGAFDAALFCLALEHVSDLISAFAAARRALRPDGRVLAVEIHPALAAAGTGAHFERDGRTIRMPTFAHTRAAYETAARAAGFVTTRVVEWRPHDFASPSARMLKRGPDAPLLIELGFVAG
jgi:malonyl-CoA O-methyltransferase